MNATHRHDRLSETAAGLRSLAPRDWQGRAMRRRDGAFDGGDPSTKLCNPALNAQGDALNGSRVITRFAIALADQWRGVAGTAPGARLSASNQLD